MSKYFLLLDNKMEIDKMSCDAQEVASKNYTLEREVEEIDRLIRTLMLE